MGIQLCSVRMSGELIRFRIVLGEEWTFFSSLSNTRELNEIILFPQGIVGQEYNLYQHLESPHEYETGNR